MTTSADHVTGPVPHPRGSGWAKAREVFGDRLPEVTDEDKRQAMARLAEVRSARPREV
jgi:hypothetical protein